MIIECPRCETTHDGHKPCTNCGWPEPEGKECPVDHSKFTGRNPMCPNCEEWLTPTE